MKQTKPTIRRPNRVYCDYCDTLLSIGNAAMNDNPFRAKLECHKCRSLRLNREAGNETQKGK